jgi:hypothetical protein
MTLCVRNFAVVTLLATTSLAAARPTPAPASVAGQWQFTVQLDMGTGTPVVTFQQDGARLTGTYEGRYGTSRLEGSVSENEITFTIAIVAQGTEVSGVFTGIVEAGTMRGDVEYEGAGGGTWTAVRMSPRKQEPGQR